MRKYKSLLTITSGGIMILLLFTVFASSGKVTPAQEEVRQQLQSLSQAFRDIARDVGPAVVYVSTEQTIKGMKSDQFRDFFGDDFFRKFFGDIPREHEYKLRGLGSGVITSKDGYILTNNHVVAKADKIKVTLSDRREFMAKVVGTDPKTDVAVIKIDGENLPVAELGDSDTIEVGDWVIAIGNPYGLSQTVTAGIVSAEGRANIGINDYEDFIQTDAAINPGNSGGPLVNIEGKVIGINTAIFSRSGGYQGIGFAIPVNMARYIQESLLTKGKVVRGWLGVMIQPVTQEIAKQFKLKETTGTLIGDVLKGSPAEKAGFERGDVIFSFDGQPIEGPNSLRNIVAATKVDKKVPVLVIRSGKEKTITVKIGEQPADMQARVEEPSEVEAEFGLRVQELTPELAEQLGYTGEKGVLITEVEPGSFAQEAGLLRGDLIQEINKAPVESLKDYNKALENAEEEKSFLALVKRGENTRYVVVEVE